MGLNRIKRTVLIIIIFAVSIFALSADERGNILSTNSWTAAFVKMAGAEAAGYSIEQLAPADMEHPPEYELKPSDVRKVRDSDLLVYAGYEVLMKTVFDSFGKPEEQLVKIMTSYSPVMLEKSVLAIAGRLGTSVEAGKNIAAYKQQIAAAGDKLKAADLYGAPVLVQFHQKPLAQALGFEILGVFGPQPLEVRQIAELGKAEPVLIIDNAHNPMAAPLEEILGITSIRLINFPGFPNESGSRSPDTLIGVLELNVDELLK